MFRLVANDRGGRAMGAVKRSDGVIVEERKEVVHEVANFYDTLFSSDETVETVQTRFFEENADCLPKINEETAKEMEEPIKIEEILRGISLLGGGKSPHWYSKNSDAYQNPLVHHQKPSAQMHQKPQERYENSSSNRQNYP